MTSKGRRSTFSRTIVACAAVFVSSRSGCSPGRALQDIEFESVIWRSISFARHLCAG